MDVECPRCAHLLPEPPGYGNYKCNHCGYVLKGMKNAPLRHGGFLENDPELEWENEKIRRYIATNLMNNSSKTSNRDKRDASFDSYGSKRQASGGSRLEMDAIYMENGGDLRYRVPLREPFHHPFARDGQGISNVYGYGSYDSSLEQGFGDDSPPSEEFAWLTRSRAEKQRWDVRGELSERNSWIPGLTGEQQRPTGHGYVDERPSYYENPSSFGYGKPVGFYDHVARPHRGLKEERADLLRELEDLKTRIARTYDMPHQTGGGVPVNRNLASIDPYRGRAGASYDHPEVVSTSEKPPYMNPSHDHISFPSHYEMEMQNYYQVPRRPASTFHEHEEPVRPQMRRRPANYAAKASHGSISEEGWDILDHDRRALYHHESFLHEAPPQVLPNVPGSSKISDDSFNSLLGNHNVPIQVKPRHTDQAGNSIATMDDLEPHPQVRTPSNYSSDHSSHGSGSNYGSDHSSHGSGSNYGSDHSSHGSGSRPPETVVDASRNKKHYHSILGAATCDNLEPWPQVRTSSYYGSDHSSHGSRSPPPERMVVSTENKKHYHPILGGAPFILCLECFELLKIPKELRTKEKSRLKLRCGACSSAILIEVKNRSLITSMWKEQPVEANKGPLDIPNKDISASRRFSDASETKSDGVVDSKETYSSHNDDSNNNTVCKNSEDNHILEDHQANINESNDSQVIHSSSSSMSFSSSAEDIQSFVIIQRNILNSPELPPEETKPQTERDSPLLQQLDSFVISEIEPAEENISYGKNYEIEPAEEDINYGKNYEIEPAEENISYDKNYENASLKKSSSLNGSFKDVSGPTEVSISLSEYPNTNVSNDSVEVSKEGNQLTTAKQSKSYLGGFIKKSIRSFWEPNQVEEKERPKVTINGHPISDDELRRAQMLAGPIQPGDYWYDYRAGFWGVMNVPCLGIIPPSIEEFKYSMPPNCAAGNTGVFVNGRELNKRDLNLLASRGLPTTADKFYSIDICGKVLDEETGEQLYSLGRLAPTVQKAKHGFGMRVPRIS